MGKNVNLLVFVSRYDDEAQAGFQGVGEASAQGRKALGGRHVEVGGRPGTGRCATNGSDLGAEAGRGRQGIAQARRFGSATPTRRRAGARTGQGTHGGRIGRRVSDRAMDAATDRQSHHPAVWRGIQHRPFVAPAASAGFLLPEAREARHPAQRAGDCSMETARLACAQKKPSEKTAPSSSSTNPD